MLLHGSALSLSSETQVRIKPSQAAYGELTRPTDDGQAIPNVPASKVDTYCHAGDNICVNGDLILPAHLTYAENVAAAATFITSQ